MARRLQLHEKFCEILGTRNVYFQPPESVKLNYDCIVYRTTDRKDIRADDRQYRHLVGYETTFITRDPDSEIPQALIDSFSIIRHVRSFTSDNLHHEVFRIYY